MQRFIYILIVLIFISCKDTKSTLTAGDYIGTFIVQDDETLNFNFTVEDSNHIKIFNADDVIEVDEIIYRNDSVFIMMPYFNTYLEGKLDGDNIVGQFVEEDRDRYVKFYAKKGKAERFKANEKPSVDVSGVWEMNFDNYGKAYNAKGIFKQTGHKVTGTIRTNTGDYRFLEGIVDGNKLRISTYDAAHLFLFTAEVSDSTMSNGVFYSGNHSRETFISKRNSDFELANSNELTYLKEGHDTFNFTFPDLEGNMVSFSDERFKDKVVLVQIMGSYCPNCLDETKFYSEYYKTLNRDDFEIIALAFENAKTTEKAVKAITRMRDRVGFNYPILLAQTGTNSKTKANEKLPMLNHVLSYPTTIYLDKKGNVRKIHTGFNGPATGEKYTNFTKEFDNFVKILLNE